MVAPPLAQALVGGCWCWWQQRGALWGRGSRGRWVGAAGLQRMACRFSSSTRLMLTEMCTCCAVPAESEVDGAGGGADTE